MAKHLAISHRAQKRVSVPHRSRLSVPKACICSKCLCPHTRDQCGTDTLVCAPTTYSSSAPRPSLFPDRRARPFAFAARPRSPRGKSSALRCTSLSQPGRARGCLDRSDLTRWIGERPRWRRLSRPGDMRDTVHGQFREPKAGCLPMLRPADADIGFAGLRKAAADVFVLDHEVSHQNGPHGRGRRGSAPRSCIGPPQFGQTSRA